MANLKRAGLVALFMACVVSVASAASIQLQDGRTGFIPAKEYDSYFVSNQHPLPPGQETEYLYIDDVDKFDSLFGLAATMDRRPEVIDRAYFTDKAVLAIIRKGLWNMKLEMVMGGPGGAEVSYTTEKVPAAFEAVTPLLIGIPRDTAKLYRFIENGKPVYVLTTEDVERAREENPGLLIAGGWTQFREVDKSAAALLEKALSGFVGSGFRPFAHSTQMVSGINHRFICEQTVTSYPPVKGVAMVSFHEGMDGRLSEPTIQSLVK